MKKEEIKLMVTKKEIIYCSLFIALFIVMLFHEELGMFGIVLGYLIGGMVQLTNKYKYKK